MTKITAANIMYSILGLFYIHEDTASSVMRFCEKFSHTREGAGLYAIHAQTLHL